MVIKYTKIFHCETLQNFPTLDFWFENKPSGNPGMGLKGLFLCKTMHKHVFAATWACLFFT
jgi:hypothetical protein